MTSMQTENLLSRVDQAVAEEKARKEALAAKVQRRQQFYEAVKTKAQETGRTIFFLHKKSGRFLSVHPEGWVETRDEPPLRPDVAQKAMEDQTDRLSNLIDWLLEDEGVEVSLR